MTSSVAVAACTAWFWVLVRVRRSFDALLSKERDADE